MPISPNFTHKTKINSWLQRPSLTVLQTVFDLFIPKKDLAKPQFQISTNICNHINNIPFVSNNYESAIGFSIGNNIFPLEIMKEQ